MSIPVAPLAPSKPAWHVPLKDVQAAAQKVHQPGQPHVTTQAAVEGVIFDAIRNQPRSLQKRIGPSEIGTECDHCLAAKLAGWEEAQSGIPWASTVGTAIHALLEDFINQADTKQGPGGPHRYVTEYPILVGQIGGTDITGSIDCLDLHTGTTIDWKCVSPTSMAKHKRGISQVYRAQAHLYAKGCVDAGIPIETVSICFLPRGGNQFHDRYWWSEPYNPQIAETALARANQLHNNLTALAAISPEARDQWISSLPRADGCYSCRRFPDAPQPPAHHDTSGITLDLPTN